MANNRVAKNGQKLEADRIQRWRWMLDQNIPIVGSLLHRRIASALTEAALSGNWLAAQSLAVVYVFHTEADVREKAGQTLRQINYTTGIDAVWGVWAETRHAGLLEIAKGYNRIAGNPASVRLLSALSMNNLTAITHGSAELVTPLIQAVGDADEVIAARAREAVSRLQNPASIDALCWAWQNNRSPFLSKTMKKAGYVAQKPPMSRVLSALKVNKPEAILHGGGDIVEPLVTACEDPDPEIARLAKLCLPQLQSEAAVDEFCRLWAETRSPLLEQALLQAAYRPRGPEPVRLLVALKTGQLAPAENASPEGLPFLLQALEDPDEAIRSSAAQAVDNLQSEETIEALCVRVIESDDPVARRIALANGYAPRTPELRALFLFLTGQLDEYDALDFDQRMLRAVYEASQPALRRRIAAQVQAAGRTDYLTILAGVDYRSRAEQVDDSEAELLIRVLAENGEYERLWRLAPELALPFSLRIIHILAENNWQPADELDAQVYRELVQLSQQPIQLAGPELDRILPTAIPRATLKVKGRINDVAFSPTQPVLAIGTNQRKVILWNFKTAQVERAISDFKRSVGKVSYTPQGTLVAAERTSTQALCTIYVCGEEETYRLCSHVGSISVLEPVRDNWLLTAGRDQKVVLWDLTHHRLLAEKEFDFWARAAAISPDQQYAVLMHDRLRLIRLPDLNVVPGYPFITPRGTGFQRGMAQNAAFSPDGKYILSGQYNGQVGLYFHTSMHQLPKKSVVTRHNQPVRGIRFLPGHPIVITAGAEGQVRFIRWPEMTLKGMVFSPEGQLTSLRVSNNGAFMATGTNEASLVLWDLRVLDIPSLFTQPLATATHDQVTNTLALGEYYSLPDPVRNGLKFLQRLLQYRFRFDIHVEEVPIIQYGEFDILLDEL